MSNIVHIAVTSGPMKDKVFTFEEHDTFLLARLEECHFCMPDDNLVSRRHFIVEVNPPDACIRDFGSLNWGGRACTPFSEARWPGDEVQVGVPNSVSCNLVC